MANADTEYFKARQEEILDMLADRRAERDDQQVELDALNQEIMQLEQLLGGIASFLSDTPPQKPDAVFVENIATLSLAEAIREILKMANDYKTARAIRDSLEISGYDLKQHTNALASVHGVLKRLFESGNADQLEAGGKTFYRWKGTNTAAAVAMPRRKTGKPVPEWYDRMTENGTKPLVYSKLTPRQRRHAVELGLVNPVAMFGPPKRKVTKNE